MRRAIAPPGAFRSRRPTCVNCSGALPHQHCRRGVAARTTARAARRTLRRVELSLAGPDDQGRCPLLRSAVARSFVLNSRPAINYPRWTKRALHEPCDKGGSMPSTSGLCAADSCTAI